MHCSLVTRTLVLFEIKCTHLSFLTSLSPRFDQIRSVEYMWDFWEANWKGADSARGDLLPFWIKSNFYYGSSLKQTKKYLSGLQTNIFHASWCSWSELSSLNLAKQDSTTGFTSGSGLLQAHAERKICCSHGRGDSSKKACRNLPSLLMLQFRTCKVPSTPQPKTLHDWSQSQRRKLLFPTNYESWQESRGKTNCVQ